MIELRAPLLSDLGRTHLGAWCSIPSLLTTEVIARSEYDYVCIDIQHGLIDLGDAIGMLQVIGTQRSYAVVRVTSPDPWEIMRVQDAGADGVIVPMIETAEDAGRVVAAFAYPPRGNRSYGPGRASLTLGTRQPEILERVACIVMIETKRGLENLDDIAAVPGIDGIYIGPSDLSLSVYGELRAPGPWLDETLGRVRRLGAQFGFGVGVHCVTGQMASRFVAQRLQMVTVTTDLTVLRGGMAAERVAAGSAS